MAVGGEDGYEAEGAEVGDEGGEAGGVVESVDWGGSRAEPVFVCRVGFEGGAFVDEDGCPGAS